MTALALSRLHFPVETLGPGRRIGVWLQGCSIRCPGCISLDTWTPGLGMTSVETVLASIASWADEADGLTVSGGEPFDQPVALAELLMGWRAISERPVLLFTGYELGQILPWLEEHTGLVDALVAGPYRRDFPQTLALRGSDNQSLHILTELGSGFAAYERTLTPADRRLDIMFDESGAVWLAGIPAPGDFKRLRIALEGQGHQVLASDQTRQVA